jgi:site-specific DNA-methyltransferase (adenine-specific)
MKNSLYLSDNLPTLRELPTASVDLVYLDPPFASKAAYSVSARALRYKALGELGVVFHDTWRYGPEAEAHLEQMKKSEHVPTRLLVEALKTLLLPLDLSMLAYVAMMAPRLVELHRVLKPSGSLYLHCDTSAGAYLKLLCDAIFGGECFLNEIVWSYRRWPSRTRYFQRMHDVIYLYARQPGPGRTFHVEYEPLSDSYRKRFGGSTQVLDPAHPSRKRKLDEKSKGMPQRDVWDIPILSGSSHERVGYPTQKPIQLIERIIRASSNPGDVVLDPFCGSGTTLVCAEALGRRWIGIDIAPFGIAHTRRRLLHRFELLLSPYDFVAHPESLPHVDALSQKLGPLRSPARTTTTRRRSSSKENK